ncbi:MAG: zinc-ribbon domain-containing protein [Phycisphaerales bacterium]
MPSLPDYIQRKKALTRALIRAGLGVWVGYLVFTIVALMVHAVSLITDGYSPGLSLLLPVVLLVCTHAPLILAVWFLQERFIRWIWPIPKRGCPDCGYPIVPNAKVCPECGKPLPA